MDKKSIAAVSAALALGFGAGKLTNASPAAPAVRVHALDLRTNLMPDGGVRVSRRAYGTERRADGGTRDVNAARSCQDDAPARQALLLEELRAAADECAWDL